MPPVSVPKMMIPGAGQEDARHIANSFGQTARQINPLQLLLGTISNVPAIRRPEGRPIAGTGGDFGGQRPRLEQRVADILDPQALHSVATGRDINQRTAIGRQGESAAACHA
jgi:hypothetical protein